MYRGITSYTQTTSVTGLLWDWWECLLAWVTNLRRQSKQDNGSGTGIYDWLADLPGIYGGTLFHPDSSAKRCEIILINADQYRTFLWWVALIWCVFPFPRESSSCNLRYLLFSSLAAPPRFTWKAFPCKNIKTVYSTANPQRNRLKGQSLGKIIYHTTTLVQIPLRLQGIKLKAATSSQQRGFSNTWS